MILRRVFSRRKTSPQAVPGKDVEQRHCMALYDYEGQSDKDISFKKGEIFEITKESEAGTGWWDARSEVTHNVGCIPSNYVTACESPASLLTTQDWFFGSVGENEAERILLKQGETGSFLIRSGGHQPNDFCLSLRDGDKVKHYAIQYTDNEGYSITPWAKFVTLSNLVHHYQQTSDGVVMKLKKPCDPFEVVPARQEPGHNRSKKRNGTRTGSESGKFNRKEIQPAMPNWSESESSAVTDEESVSTSLENELRQGHPEESLEEQYCGTSPEDVQRKRRNTSSRGVQIIRTLPLIPIIGAFVLFAHVTSLWTE